MEQEHIENTPPSTEESGVILQETSPPVGEQEVLKETLPSAGPQEILEIIPPSVEEQEVPKETSPSVDEQGVTKENPPSDEEQQVPKETPPSDEQQKVLKKTLPSVEEQEVPKETSPSVDEQEVLKEIPTTEEQQVSKEPTPFEVEQDGLLNESEIKKEPMDIQEAEFHYVHDTIVISDDDDEELNTSPVPLSLPITLSTLKPSSYAMTELLATEHSGNVNKLYYYAPKRYTVKKPKRRCSSVPKYVKLLTEPGKSNYANTDSESDDDFPFEVKLKSALKPSLKRKRSLIIPDNLEFENTRKTMKPGPKSKTRNIATVHDMINEAKRLGYDPSMGFNDSSDEEMSVDSDDSCDESELNIIEIIDLVDSSDDEADVIKSGTVECVIDNNETSEKDAKENSINDENTIIDITVSETLNETEVLENAIDSIKMKEDENTENKEIHPNQILEDKNDNDEVEEKNGLNDKDEVKEKNGLNDNDEVKEKNGLNDNDEVKEKNGLNDNDEVKEKNGLNDNDEVKEKNGLNDNDEVKEKNGLNDNDEVEEKTNLNDTNEPIGVEEKQ